VIYHIDTALCPSMLGDHHSIGDSEGENKPSRSPVLAGLV